MYASHTLDTLDAARLALLAYEGAVGGEGRFLEADSPLSAADEAQAIKLLDAAGAIEAVLDCDFSGNRRWRVRAVTSAGHDVARLIRNDHVWSRLKRDLAARADPVGDLVRSYRDACLLA